MSGPYPRSEGDVTVVGDMLHVGFGDGAVGTVSRIQNEHGSLGWKLIWNEPCERNNMAAASAIDTMNYLIDHCTKEELWRRVKLLRKARQEHAA